ncbi:MAG: glycosyltransferase [Kiritimatiellae bacterium]|nr:glycosyltransferase [Kiritimatiellia bacterium]
MNDVCIVVATHNRIECLKNLLAAIDGTAPGADVLVVDNASTDGTCEFATGELRFADVSKGMPQYGSRRMILRLPVNAGGSGAFHEGMRLAYETGYEYIWVMDDDVVALPGAIDALKRFASIAPAVQPVKLDAHGRVFAFEGMIHPKSFRRSRLSFGGNDYVPCNAANFEGMFMRRETIEKAGLPEKDFFIAWDDTYYGWKVAQHVRNIYVNFPCIQKQFDKERFSTGSKRWFSSSLFSRYFHLRNFRRIIALEHLGARAWIQYAYEWCKAFALTAVFECSPRKTIWLFRAIADGAPGRDLQVSTKRFLEAQ